MVPRVALLHLPVVVAFQHARSSPAAASSDAGAGVLDRPDHARSGGRWSPTWRGWRSLPKSNVYGTVGGWGSLLPLAVWAVLDRAAEAGEDHHDPGRTAAPSRSSPPAPRTATPAAKTIRPGHRRTPILSERSPKISNNKRNPRPLICTGNRTPPCRRVHRKRRRQPVPCR